MIAAVETQFENLAMSMAEGYKNDVEKFCDANPVSFIPRFRENWKFA